MTLQISKIIIYGRNGKRRDVDFELGKLNIVTGGSKTGKSALLEVVDYVWGRDECTFPEGPPRRALSWFGVLLDRQGEKIFLARKNPDVGAKASDEYHMLRSVADAPSSANGLTKNITSDALKSVQGELLGIQENEHRPSDGGTRAPVAASARHAIIFCLQGQDEIANRALLFHRQGESSFLAQSIKDTLPYFLGAVDADTFRQQLLLDEARKRFRKLERERDAAKAADDQVLTRAIALVEEARQAKLLPGGAPPVSPTETMILLRQALQQGESVGALVLTDPQTEILALQNERSRLREQLRGIQDEEGEFERLLREGEGYAREASEQRARLAAVGLIKPTDPDHSSCPLCNSAMATPTPSAQDITKALRQVGAQLDSVARDRPQLEAHRRSLVQRREATEELLRTNSQLTRERIAASGRLQAQQALFIEQARSLGRIGLYIETSQDAGPGGEVSQRLEVIAAQIEQLESSLDADALAERIASALNLVGQYMTAIARLLELEHGSKAIRLDRRKLTIVADTNEGPIPLAQIGSGENWIGYHVAAHLALHKLFHERNRPVPGFLMLDQPSQAHYPADPEDPSTPAPTDEDRIAVNRLFRQFHAAADPKDGKLQIIVVDHVDIKEDWFTDAVRKRFRRGEKLVPADWISGTADPATP